MSNNGWQKLRRLLVVCLGGLSDAVALTPALRGLHRSLPQTKISFLTTPVGRLITPLLPSIDNALSYCPSVDGASAMDSAYYSERELALIELLELYRFDGTIIFTSHNQSAHLPAQISSMAGIPLRLGYGKKSGNGALSQCVEAPADDLPALDRHLHLLEAAGFSIPDQRLELEWPDGVEERADALLERAGIEAGDKFVLMTARTEAPIGLSRGTCYVTVLQGLKSGRRPLKVIAAAERDRNWLAFALDEHSNHASADWRWISIPELVALMRRAGLIAADDPDLVQLGRILGLPALAWRWQQQPAIAIGEKQEQRELCHQYAL